MTEPQHTTTAQALATAPAAGDAPRSRSRRAARIAAAATVVLAAGALLTGCGGKGANASGPDKVPGSAAPAGGDSSSGSQSDDGKGSGSSTDTGSTDASGSSSASSTASGKDAANDGAAAGPGSGGGAVTGSSRCHTSELRARFGPDHPGAGQRNFTLVLTNASHRTCTVRGYPGLAFVNGKGEEVSIDPHRSSGSKQTISLRPGNSAWAPLSYSSPEMTGVTTVTPTAAKVTPPDERDPLTASWSGGPVTNTGKASVPEIGPLSPGTGA